ncbi:MAG: DUF3131 domain-containing protein [Methylococcales bacterium]|nr:DUF3131 domain-containing protein [Methylococcales bacterium]
MKLNKFHLSLLYLLVVGGCADNQPRRLELPLNNKGDIDLPHGKHPGRNGELTPQEMKMARVAWKYFENNYQQSTGLVNAADNYPSTTMWDTASYLAALVSVYELKIIEKPIFDLRLTTLLETLNGLSFFRNGLPNKVYHTQTSEKVNYGNQPGEIGTSGLDLGRLLIWLKIIKERYPDYSDVIDKFVLRWNFSNLLDSKGTIYGASFEPSDTKAKVIQEGRLGYEEYAAKGFELWGFDTTQAAKAEPYSVISIFGIDIPYDSRDPRIFHAHNYVVSESYVLDAIEFNWDLANDSDGNDAHFSHPWMEDFAQRIYKVQEQRYKQTGILTARTEHQLDQDPYFVYDTIYSDGITWNTLTESGDIVPQFAAIATKGVLGLWVLWETEYTDLLFSKIADLYDPQKGFYEGVYENGSGVIKQQTANNNGIILETLLYKVQGKLLRFSGRQSLWDKAIAEKFNE